MNREQTITVELKVKHARALLGPPTDEEIAKGGTPWVSWLNCNSQANAAIRRALARAGGEKR